MKQQINEIRRMQQLAGILREGNKDTIDEPIKVGQVYNYNFNNSTTPPFKVKVTKISTEHSPDAVNGGQYFDGEVLEDNETTKHVGYKKGEIKKDLNASNIVRNEGDTVT